MVKWKRRGCARCGGTTYIEKEGTELYEKCLMCSYRVELKTKVDSAAGPFEEDTESASSRC